MPPYTLARQFNNNVVLALDEATKAVVICTGKGVGFGIKPGSAVDEDKIEVVYVPQDSPVPAAISQTLGWEEPEILDIARTICLEAGRVLKIPHPEMLILAIADHLHQAIRRSRQNIRVDIPLVWEVKHLYPDELSLGERLLELVKNRLNVQLPAAEATAFALHFVGTQFDESAIEKTMRMTQTFEEIFDEIDRIRDCPLDRFGQPAARFIAHLRYLFARLENGTESVSSPKIIQDILSSNEYGLQPTTNAVSSVITKHWGWHIKDVEKAYIALHIYRLLHEEN